MFETLPMYSHSACQGLISLSCSVTMLSMANGTVERIILERLTTPSEYMGFLLWGMVLLPTFPILKGSSSSPHSVFCSVITSLAIFPSVDESKPRTETYSATVSREACQEIGGTARPRSVKSLLWTSRPSLPREAIVPTAPENWPMNSLSLHCSSLSMFLPSSATQTAIL